LIESLHPNTIALIAAFFTAASQTLIGKAIGQLSPGMAALIANLMIALVATLLYAAGDGMDAWPPMGIFLFAVSGVIANFAARYLMYSAISIIGLSRTQVLFQFSPLWSSIVAIIFLGERPTLAIGIGNLFIVSGAILIVVDRKRDSKNIRLFYYLLPILAALIMAAAPSIRKFAFTLIPSATFGLMVACIVASSLQAAILPYTERKTGIHAEMRPLLIAVAGGLLNAAAALTFWTSLKLGEVTQVVPVRRLSVLLVVLFSWLFLGKQDRITWRVVAGAAITLLGGGAIVWGG
jgi:transporter family protein